MLEPVTPRRAFVGAALAGAVALRLRPENTQAAAPPPLSDAELRSLVAWYDTLVPGAAHAHDSHDRVCSSACDALQTRDRPKLRAFGGPGSAEHRFARATRCTAAGTP